VIVENVCRGREVCFTKDKFYFTLARGSNHPNVKVMSEKRTIKGDDLSENTGQQNLTFVLFHELQ